VARVAARRGVAVAALLLALASGCVGSGQLMPDLGTAAPPPVAQVTALWSKEVMAGVDPLNHGAPLYGLAGRILLYGSDMKNAVADGKLVVELWATLPEQPQAPPAWMGKWEIDRATLQAKCLKTDSLGPGYTLNLPWPTYRPDITHLEIKVRYEPAKGLPVFTSGQVLLNNGPVPTPTYTRRMETGDRQPIVTAAAPPGAVQPPSGMQPAGGMQLAGGVQQPGLTSPSGAMQQFPVVQPQAPVQQAGGVPQQQMQQFQPVQQAGGVPQQQMQQFQPAPPFPGFYQR
jgi:hypothetical protein